MRLIKGSEEAKEDTPAAESPAPVATVSGPQMPLTPVMETKPHSYTGYKQNSYCLSRVQINMHSS